MTEPPRRRPGRPPIDPTDPSVPLTVSLPGTRYAFVKAQAKREHISAPEWIRRRLREASQHQRSQP